MKASELRIGNYVVGLNNTPHKVEKIDDEKVVARSLHFDVTSTVDIGSLDLKPIPLTEEWLGKMGFEHENKNGEKRYSLGFHRIYYLQGFVFRLFGTNDHDCEVEILHVHQLQNLFFALTGEELEFEK